MSTPVKGSAAPKILRYWWHRLQHRNRADFIDMGLGIEARAARYHALWEPHLRLSQGFIRSALGHAGLKSVIVLGAGRLFDVPDELLSGTYQVTLIDADPGARASWPQRPWITPRLLELTGVLDEWTRHLEAGRSDPCAVLERLRRPAVVDIPKADLVISLNLLGQIPIYWRDRVAQIVGESAEEDNPRLHRALVKTIQMLEKAHRDQLSASGAPRIIVLADDEYYYYDPEISPFQVEPALHLNPAELPGYALTRTESWWWHLRPAGAEGEPYGEIHRVRAFEFRKV